MKRRILRIGLTTLVVVLFTGYFLFTTLFFSPFEDDYGYDLSTLIPRDVDFYVSKAGLLQDFDPFPRPAFADEFAASRGGQAVMALPVYRELMESLDLETRLAELDQALEGLPVEIDLLSVFGGRDLALAGFLKGADWAGSDWAAYGRTNWMGKLGVAALGYPDLIGLSDQGITVTETGGVVSLSGGALSRPLFLSRVADVLVVGTTADLVGQAAVLESQRGQDSFGQSAKYVDYIALPKRDDEELEFYLDYRTLAQEQGLTERWPDSSSTEFVPAFFGKLFQRSLVRELMGAVSFGSGVTSTSTGLLSTESMTALQKRLYRARGVDRARIIGERQVANLIPADVGLFAYVNAGLGDLLRQASLSVERDLISNLEDLVREVWGYADLEPLIDELDGAFKDRIGFCLRDNDYPDEGADGPPHNDYVVPAWAVIFEIEDAAKIEGIHTRINANTQSFGISGREPGTHGVFLNTVQGGHRVYEYWSQLIDGTGHVATLELEEFFIVSNNHQMLGAMVRTYYGGTGATPRLGEDRWFQTQIASGLPSMDALLWFDPRAMSPLSRKLTQQWADDALVIDWSVERPRIERKIIKEQFPGETWGSLSSDVEEQLAMLYDAEATRFEEEFRAQNGPALRQRYQKRQDALEILEGALIELSVDQKQFQLFVRLITPFDE